MIGPTFAPSEEQQLLISEVRRFANEQILPGASQRDAEKQFPKEILAEMSEMGLLGMFVPEEFGGAGFDMVSYVMAVEEVSRTCASIGVTMSVTNSVCCWPILKFGSEQLKAAVLPKLASGGALGGFGLTEPGAGSDAGGIRTTAVREGEFWVLDGEKAWITNAGEAEFFVVVARTDPEAGNRGLTAFVVPSDAPGFSVGPAEHKLGLRSSLTAPLNFSNCRIAASNLLGTEGLGFKIAMATLDHSRLGIAAQSVGIHQRALELARDYALEREQFGGPIAKQQAVQFMLADIATELEAARTLTRCAAAVADQSSNPDAGRLASEAKLFASEAANRACYSSLQLHGGNGFHEDYEIARLYRDVRVTTIYEGTSEMQRLVIARKVLG